MGTVQVASEADAEAIAAIYAPYVVGTAISFEETAPTSDEMARRIASTLPTFPFLVFEEAGAVLGYCYGAAHGARPAYRWACNVSVYVAQAAQQRGVGRALYSALFELLDRQGFHALFAGIALPNAGSVALHEAMGFEHLGTYHKVGFKLGAWRDVGYWRRGLREGLPAADPIPFQALGA
ncbi:MAG TPA: arsinothricin resistance N-acetyltransferase ArsN1 family B [Caulobacter sp.]|nr:arsinothricin resistance N-acetyltransferase ArsN1 family B [Caulobacter sp.]